MQTSAHFKRRSEGLDQTPRWRFLKLRVLRDKGSRKGGASRGRDDGYNEGSLTTSPTTAPAESSAPMILRNRLPAVQSFLRPAHLSASAAGFVCRLILTFCCHLGRNSASQAASLPRCDPRHPAAVGRFLGRQRWARGDWMAPLAPSCSATNSPRMVCSFSFWIRPVPRARARRPPTPSPPATARRRPRRGRRYTTKKNAPKRCHGFVCGLLLTPSGLRIPYRRSYYTHEYCEQKGLPHRTQAELGADLIRDLELPSTARVVVLGDTAYEADSVQRACAARGFSWITPGNPERVLAGQKPRPKVRSLLEQVSTQRFVAVQVHPDTDPYAPQRRWSASAPDRSKRGRTYWVCKQRLQVHSVERYWCSCQRPRSHNAGNRCRSRRSC